MTEESALACKMALHWVRQLPTARRRGTMKSA
jgi:hypothetical protein